MSQVKGKQAAKSRETQRRIRTAAGELFVERGYGNTSLQDIADHAGVAVQTIYFTFRNKRNLLKELVDVTVAGDEESLATMDRPWFTRAMDAKTAQEHLLAHVEGATAILGRVALITDVLHAAASIEPELDALRRQGLDQRYTVQEASARALLDKPGAVSTMTADQAADVLFAVLSPELYLLFVRDRGWSADRWERWAGTTLCAQLLENHATS
ncbi:TetR/AcrR family transcriptional regulator [Nocardia sp. NBC_01009]|uniref:TetR/AcrR family transcriptional regulator n=1 Tax=Nocardia sp. NBC_01009 TaxID=2975996 RepID=UPI003868774C|nr:TetR/AcrR family transcriptional regulator [Nocardia sp. NBC_01009]